MKRRFIAGAVCPQCALQDKLVMYDDEDGQRVRECVRCGFSDVLVEEPPAEPLATRIQPPAEPDSPPDEVEVSVVRVLDPGRAERDH